MFPFVLAKSSSFLIPRPVEVSKVASAVCIFLSVAVCLNMSAAVFPASPILFYSWQKFMSSICPSIFEL